MENSAGEAIKNNVLGTYNTADMAEKYGVKKFILISTDKAVNPTNVMGASKRMCEMVVQCRRAGSNTEFAAVRFGNVLGSNGSVIPLFRRQIQSGGPVTITDKRIIRYFMTIPEASQLVMHAGAMAKSGELFVLDMGKPIKILDLAENIIRLSGLIPYRDIDIKEIGLRPGEKLYEELLIKTEDLDKTENKLIFIERDEPLSRSEVEEKLSRLREVVDADPETVRRVMMELIPTFRDPNAVNSAADESEEMKIVAENASENSDVTSQKSE
jgi:FlaA1/EpsC-like NDP-sugar epimerase